MKSFLSLVLLAFASSSSMAADVCTLANFWNVKASASTLKVVCTNATDSKTLARVGDGNNNEWTSQAYADMKNEAVKVLLEAGYKPVDAITYSR